MAPYNVNKPLKHFLDMPLDPEPTNRCTGEMISSLVEVNIVEEVRSIAEVEGFCVTGNMTKDLVMQQKAKWTYSKNFLVINEFSSTN